MKKKKRTARLFNPAALNTTITVKVSPEFAQELELKALRYADGSRSEYVRTALVNYVPKKEDF